MSRHEGGKGANYDSKPEKGAYRAITPKTDDRGGTGKGRDPLKKKKKKKPPLGESLGGRDSQIGKGKGRTKNESRKRREEEDLPNDRKEVNLNHS